MSERGAWCTEYIHCDKCRAGFRAFLKKTDATPLPDGKYWSGGEITAGVFAGRIGGLYAKEELHTWEQELEPELSPLICHDLRVAVIAEDGERFYTVRPSPPRTGEAHE